MATKPDEMIKWCEDNPAGRIQPPLASEQGGYPKNAVPPFQWVNWKFWNIARWIKWLEEMAEASKHQSTSWPISFHDDDEPKFTSDGRFDQIGDLVILHARVTRATVSASSKRVRIDPASFTFAYGSAGPTSIQVTRASVPDNDGGALRVYYAGGASEIDVRSNETDISGFYITLMGKAVEV